MNTYNMKNLFIINEEEKNKILNLHKTATKRHYLSEQPYLDMYQPVQPDVVGPQGPQTLLDAGAIVKQGDYGDPYIYAKLGDNYYFAKASEGDNPNWRLAKKEKGIRDIKSKIFNEKIPVNTRITPPKLVNNNKITPVKTGITPRKNSQNFCPSIPSSKGVDLSKMGQYQSIGGSLISEGVPQRSACEISYIKIRPKFNNKSFFVVDTKYNNIYLFNKQGEFVAKSYTIDGLNAQSQDAKSIAKALWSWDEYTKAAGFKWDGATQKYEDKTNKGRTYNHDLIYDYIDKNKSRFFPKGIYSINKLKSDDIYVGGDDNVFKITTSDGKEIAQAIHGFYNEPPRVKAMQQLKNAMGSHSSPTDKNIPDKFVETVEQYLGTSKFNKSYGCINLPTDFLKIAKPYAVNSLVFVIGETDSNYLVQNDKFFGDMGGDSQQCPNPESLGEILPTIDAVA